jgi:hypothetical protein
LDVIPCQARKPDAWPKLKEIGEEARRAASRTIQGRTKPRIRKEHAAEVSQRPAGKVKKRIGPTELPALLMLLFQVVDRSN